MTEASEQAAKILGALTGTATPLHVVVHGTK